MLSLDVDPKLAWALRHRETFPVDVNRAPRETLLRVPGLGVKTVDKMIAMRAHRRIRYDDLIRLRVPVKKVAPFVETVDHRPRGDRESGVIRRDLREPSQPDLFG
jgi:predicted DNA-binding helix-hairpin-helix protein